MGKVTTFGGRIRSKGGGKLATPAPALHCVVFSTDNFVSGDTTQVPVRVGYSASEGEYLYLPKGAMVVAIAALNTPTGGTNPTVDIGIDADDDEIFANYVMIDATRGTFIPAVTSDAGAAKLTGGLAAESRVTANVGSTGTPATSGTVTFQMLYYVYDDGKAESAV